MINNVFKCELCRCVFNKDDLTLLPYSKGDYFCKSCLKVILGVRRCAYCDEEFYYTSRNSLKLFCYKRECYNANMREKYKKKNITS